jgi:cytochrome c
VGENDVNRFYTGGIILSLIVAGAALVQWSNARAAMLGDSERGHQIYDNQCSACHSLDANRVGPAHRGVYGRKAGSAPGYAYSDGVRASRIVWTEVTLDRWLTNPQATIAGARMGFRLADPQQRADVIAYLKQQSPPKR